MITRDAQNPAASGGDMQPWEFARYLSHSGHQVTYLTTAFPGCEGETVVDGVRVVRRGPVLLQWLNAFRYYRRHCRGQYDVVVQEGFGGSRIPRLAPLYVREPVVTEWHQVHHDLFATQYPGPMVSALDLLEHVTARLNRKSFVRAGTAEWADAFARIGFDPARIFVLPVTIPDEWLADEPTPPGRREPIVLWLGKFRRYKCPDHMVRAMQRVVLRVPDARLILAGRHDDRRYEARLAELTSSVGLSDRIEFRFNVSEREKRELLNAARVMVLPSSVEGFGIVVLEANACGLPVVASSGVPVGAVRDGYNGVRYPFGDIDALAESVSRVLTDGGEHAALSRNAVAFAHGFAWSKVAPEFERVLTSVAEHGKLRDRVVV